MEELEEDGHRVRWLGPEPHAVKRRQPRELLVLGRRQGSNQNSSTGFRVQCGGQLRRGVSSRPETAGAFLEKAGEDLKQ